MIRIGICDDNDEIRKIIHSFCETFLQKNKIEYDFFLFSSGEEVVAYCEKAKTERIDLLFLDIEMEGMSGIEVKNRVLHERAIWRIVFISGYEERVFEAFGVKTIGFIVKPNVEEKLYRAIEIVLKEIEDEQIMEINNAGNGNTEYIRLQDIVYLKADGNYTQIFMIDSYEQQSILCLKKLKEFEKEITPFSFTRVHKSYMVNLAHVIDIRKDVVFRDMEEKIPVGRFYKEKLKKDYLHYMVKVMDRMM